VRTNLYDLCNFAMKGFLLLYYQQERMFRNVWTAVWGMLNVSLSCHAGKTVKYLIHTTPFMVENCEEKQWHHIFRENNFAFISASTLYGTQTSIVGIVTKLQARSYGVQIPAGARDFYSPKHPDQPWGPPSLLFNVYVRYFWGLGGCKVAGAWCSPVTFV
jgi:hypothetical protein